MISYACNFIQIFEYGRQLLTLGCFYKEFDDAIKEGDGTRVHRCWKYLLPIFKSSGRKNYSIEVLQMLNQVEFVLTPRESSELLWNRFVNIHGTEGKNIPCDLHMEHLNRLCKDAVYGLQANKTPTAIVRVGKSLGPLSRFLEKFDKENGIRVPTGAHHKPNFSKDRDIIVRELQQNHIFCESDASRKHRSFPKVKVLLYSTSREELHTWIIQHLN